jgi:oligopeptide transport system permease protein
MGRYAMSRLVAAVPTLLAIITLAFVMLRVAPGGPFDSERRMPDEVRAALETHYHLNESLPAQYLHYLGQLARGDLGPSYYYRDRGVNELIAEALPVDIAIGGLALLLACLVGIPLGALAAWRGGWVDRVAGFVSLAGISMPVYVVAPLVILLFAVTLQWLPAGGWGGGAPRYIVLPVVSMALPYIAYVTRITRAGFLDTLQQPYIRAARARGLSTRAIVFGHALRPSLVPLVAFLGPAVVGAITGSIVIESTFGLDGIGQFFVRGAFNRDYSLVMGVTVLYGVLIVLANLAVDLLQALLDPRVRLR